MLKIFSIFVQKKFDHLFLLRPKATTDEAEEPNNDYAVEVNGIDLVVREKAYDSSICRIRLVVIDSPGEHLNGYRTERHRSHSLERARERCLRDLASKVNEKYSSSSSDET